MSPKKTMMIAQKLYEEGLITYMRTDSIRLSDEFVNRVSRYHSSNMKSNYDKTFKLQRTSHLCTQSS